jgi:hypothetical protein
VLTNLVNSDSVVPGSWGKLPSPVNGSQFPNAFTSILDIAQSSASGRVTKPDTIPASAGWQATSAIKKRTPPELAAAALLVIPSVTVNAQPAGAALLTIPDAVVPSPEAAPKTDATARTDSPPTLVPLPKAFTSQPLNPLASITDSEATASIRAASFPQQNEDSPRVDESPATPAGVTNEPGAISPPLPLDTMVPGEVRANGAACSTVPGESNTNLEPQFNLSLPQANGPDVPPPSFEMPREMARAVASGQVASPLPASTQIPAKAWTVEGTVVKGVVHHPGERPLGAASAQSSNSPESGNAESTTPQSGAPIRNASALSGIISPPGWMQSVAQGQTVSFDVGGNHPARNLPTPVLPAGHEHPAPEMTSSPSATTVTATPNVVAVVATALDPVKPQVSADPSVNPAANPLASVSAPAAQPSSGQTAAPASRPSEPAFESTTRLPLPPETTGAAVVQTARMIEGIGQSEMHIGLRTQAFGSVEVHTGLRDTQLGLSVSSEKGDLRGFLQSDVPALQNALQQHDLRFENIHFLQTDTGHSSGFSNHSDSHRHSFTPSGALLSPLPVASATAEESGESTSEATRLSVHA